MEQESPGRQAGRGRGEVTFRTIDNRPIYWTDTAATTHLCEGADVHPGVRLLWTLCHRDVPAGAALLPGDADKPTCAKCLEVSRS